MKRLSLDVHPATHQALKLLAVQNQTSMAAILTRLLEDHVATVSPLHRRLNDL